MTPIDLLRAELRRLGLMTSVEIVEECRSLGIRGCPTDAHKCILARRLALAVGCPVMIDGHQAWVTVDEPVGLPLSCQSLVFQFDRHAHGDLEEFEAHQEVS